MSRRSRTTTLFNYLIESSSHQKAFVFLLFHFYSHGFKDIKEMTIFGQFHIFLFIYFSGGIFHFILVVAGFLFFIIFFFN